MKKYLSIAALMLASQVSAMDSAAVEQTATAVDTGVLAEVAGAVDATVAATQDPINALAEEIIAALQSEGYTEVETLNLLMTIKALKERGLADKQIIQRLQALTANKNVRVSRKNTNKVIISMVLSGIVCAGLTAAVALKMTHNTLADLTAARRNLDAARTLPNKTADEDIDHYIARLKTDHGYSTEEAAPAPPEVPQEGAHADNAVPADG